MDYRNEKISFMVAIRLILERYVYLWYGPLTRITIEDIFIKF